jgi:leucyl-tRNA synthetase
MSVRMYVCVCVRARARVCVRVPEPQVLHKTIKKVTMDTDKLSFNTAIAAMMEFVNDAYKWDSMPNVVAKAFVQLLNPYAPHMAEELWERLGMPPSISNTAWPTYDEQYLVEDEVKLAVQVISFLSFQAHLAQPPNPNPRTLSANLNPEQVNGKVRATISVAADADQAAVMAVAEVAPCARACASASV